MTFTLTPISVKDKDGAPKAMTTYSDGTNNAFAHAVLDAAGALISPATAGNQTTGNTSLATIATNTAGLATAAAQTTGNTTLATIATNTAGVATSAKQDTGNTSLAAIATNTSGIATASKQDTGNTALATIATNTGNGATATLQTAANTKLDSVVTNTANITAVSTALGAKADTAATDDSGTFSLIAFIKRGLANWTTLQAKLPALVGGRIPVDGSGVTQPVAAAANSTGGASVYAATGSGNGNALLAGTVVSVKASAGNLYGVSFVNTGNLASYVQLFDVASGGVVPGTTAPKMVFWVPAGGAWEEKFTGEAKVAFGTAISAVATTGPANGSAATGVIANIVYQ